MRCGGYCTQKRKCGTRSLRWCYHRAHDMAGIATSDEYRTYVQRGIGEVAVAFSKDKLSHMKGSVGIGDTESDVGIFELVEEAICFNPTEKLVAIARQKGWKIVVERKDAIYEIRHDKLIN